MESLHSPERFTGPTVPRIAIKQTLCVEADLKKRRTVFVNTVVNLLDPLNAKNDYI
jgi:hypothetical protein